MRNTKSIIGRLVNEVRTSGFQKTYIKIHQHEMLRRQTRKNLFFLSLAYGALVVTLVVSLF